MEDKFQNGQMRANYLANLVEEKFASFRILPNAQRKVVSGILMTCNDVVSKTEIISVATGTKCIFHPDISPTGEFLNDLHAEILSRRSLIKYFYDQLDVIANNQHDLSIFTLREGGKGYKLKTGIKFHLYIRRIPCGDSIISNEKKYVKILRAKVILEGGVVRVKQNKKNLNKFRTMSCSDKICSWNVVGLQGALLSHFINPVYLDSIIIGEKIQENCLERALFGRIEALCKKLLPPYSLNRPSIFVSPSNRRKSRRGKTPKMAIIWSINDVQGESVDTKTGLLCSGGVSRLCKIEFLRRFVTLLEKMPVTSLTKTKKMYFCLKEASLLYKTAKKHLHLAFKNGNMGTWVSKSVVYDKFGLTSNTSIQLQLTS